jgi:taurine--2-oxoglutarate transaminase
MTKEPFFWTWTKQTSDSAYSLASTDSCRLQLLDGSLVVDGMSSNFQAGFGHSCAHIKNTIKRQLDEFPVASPKFSFDLKTRVSCGLINLVNCGDARIFYTLSGAESIENALKMARQISGKTIICARRKSYHGATLGAMSVTGDWRGQGHFGVSECTMRIPEPSEDPDLAKTRTLIQSVGPENIAAFCLETISGMNGVIIPPKTWWEGISSICKEFGIFLIIDEVSCGFGRTGPAFALHHYNIDPDFVCMAKAITGGYVPFGALWVKESVSQFYDHHVLSAGLTAYAHPLGLAATEAVLEIWCDPKFQDNKRLLEQAFAEGSSNLKKNQAVKDVRSIGLIAAIELTDGLTLSWQHFIRAGVHLAIKENTIVLAPPMVMSPDECEEMFALVGEAIQRR